MPKFKLYRIIEQTHNDEVSYYAEIKGLFFWSSLGNYKYDHGMAHKSTVMCDSLESIKEYILSYHTTRFPKISSKIIEEMRIAY